jgi:hypothetical protein
MNQEPIETHPSFENLNDSYGPYDPINRVWPRFISRAGKAAGLSGGISTTAAATNPMYGVSSYMSPGCVYRVTYTDLSTDQNAFTDIGVYTKSPPDLPESFATVNKLLGSLGSRDWLKMAPKLRRHGNAVTVIEEYMLSGPRGWFPPIYDRSALKGQSL